MFALFGRRRYRGGGEVGVGACFVVFGGEVGNGKGVGGVLSSEAEGEGGRGVGMSGHIIYR